MPFKKGQVTNPKGRPKGGLSAAHREIKERSQDFVESDRYWKNLQARILKGRAPHAEILLFHYAYGKPVDRFSLTNQDGTKDYVAELLDFRQRAARLFKDPDQSTTASEN